jgi:WXG100 family type VII secretion target
MSNIIHYNVEELIGAGSQFNGHAEEVQGIFDQLAAVNENLAAEWTGPARERFVELYLEVSPSFSSIVQLILSTGQLLQDVAAHTEQNEQNLVSGMGFIQG